MLISFEVENFRSFRDRVSFSMKPDGRLKKIRQGIVDSNPELLGLSLIYGPNASGKSNFFAAIQFVHNAVREPLIRPFINQFRFHSGNPISAFAITFLTNSGVNEYVLEYEESQLSAESLTINGILYLSKRKDGAEFSGELRVAGLFPEEFTNLVLKNEQTALSILGRLLDGSPTEALTPDLRSLALATDWLRNGMTFPTWRHSPFLFETGRKTVTQIKHDQRMNARVQRILQAADFAISDISIEEAKQPETQQRALFESEYPVFTHSILNGDSALFQLYEESAGTRHLFDLAGELISAVDARQTLFIDEIDNSFHTDIVFTILDSFQQNFDTHTQLICTTHNTNLLDQNWLRRDQLWFVERSPAEGHSALYSLRDFRAQSNESYEKSYLSGKFGAVPRISSTMFNEALFGENFS